MGAPQISLPAMARAMLRAVGAPPKGTVQIRTTSKGDVEVEARVVYDEAQLTAMGPIRVLEEESPTV